MIKLLTFLKFNKMNEFAVRSLKIILGSCRILAKYCSFLRPKTGNPNNKYAQITDPSKYL